jgi:tetratricopeptide (TPR) repeat protein
VASGIPLTYETVRIALASTPEDSISIPAVRAGLAHDPANPVLLHQLGSLYSSSPTELDLTEALKDLRQAVALSPKHWDYWVDLAATCDTVGDTACSDEAFERARALNSRKPRLLWIIGNHYFLTNRVEKGFPYFRQLLEVRPEYLGPTFRLCLRATGDPQQVYSEVVPQGKDPALRTAFLTFLTATGDLGGAMRIWQQMVAGPNRPTDLPSVKLFLDFLIDHNQISSARTIWDDLARLGLVVKDVPTEPGNLIYNGSFEQLPLNTGFDWRYNEGSDLLFDFSDPYAYQGSRSLRIEFPVGRDLNYDLFGQVVPVKPNTRYQLTAYVRSEGLTSDSGPRWRVVFGGCSNCLVPTSEQTLGTTKWHAVDVTFTTPPETQSVRISFWRPPGRLAPRDISGVVWVDDVSLRAAPISGPRMAHNGYR